MSVVKWTCAVVAAGIGSFVLGYLSWPQFADEPAAMHGSGWYTAEFFDAAYAKAGGAPTGATSGLVAHHLLVADKIAEVFEALASDDVKTVVIVSPNHFGRGLYPAQVSKGAWTTPFGTVKSDVDAVDALLAADATLRHAETPFTDEHGVYGLMPFVARSFPNARVVAIVVREGLSAEAASELGESIARTLPDAVFIASVDMTHYQDAEYTAANDAKVLDALARGDLAENLEIDSNTSMRVLFGLNAARGTWSWHLTHHGSSLAMGAATRPEDNTSHILGYFTPTQ